MDFKELETFLAIVERGSISAAAAALGISQPAVSKRVSRLEEEMGAKLFNPGHRHSALTPEGEAFHRGVIKLVEMRRRMGAEIAQSSRDLTGHVTIAASTIPGELLLPQILGRFIKRHPGVTISVKVSDTQGAVALLGSRQAELAVVGSEKNLPAFHTSPVFHDELVVALPRGHQWSDRPFLTFGDIENETLVGRLPGSGTNALCEREWRNWSGAVKEAPLRFGSATALLAAVAGGAGVGVVSRLAAENCPKINWVPLRPKVVRSFYLIRSSCERRVVEALADAIAAEANNQPQQDEGE